MKNIVKLISFIVTFIIGNLMAQKNYSLQECIDYALKNNENIKTANYHLQHDKQFKKTATEMPKTTVMYTQGQFNSKYQYDNNITISQTLPNPAVFVSHNSLAKAQIKGSEYKLEATKADLIYQVKTAYYSLLYSSAVHKVLLREDSIYEGFAKSVAAKYEAGKATLLEKTTAETQVIETKNQVTESEEDINNYQIQLQTLMHINNDVIPKEDDFVKNYLTVNTDSHSIAEHPFLKHLKQQIKVNDKVRSLETAKILPDITVSYFNQSIYGPANIGDGDYFLTTANRLQGFQLGVAIPLWFYPQRAKVKAAQINTQLAESDYKYNVSILEGHFKQAATMYIKYHNSISYYQKNVLGNLQIMVQEAFKSYGTQDFNYNDYLDVISKALSIQRHYLTVINQNNMHALKLEYLLSK